MGLIYKVENAALLKTRNEIFKEVGIPALLANGFEPDPYKTSWHGEYDRSIRGYIYQFSRISQEKYLERIEISIISGEKWIKIFLNIFEVKPNLSSLSLLKDFDGLKFSELAFRMTKIRLRSDEYMGPPLFYMLFLPEHKLGSFYTKWGYNRKTEKLRKLIKSDMENIDGFIERWHQLFFPIKIDWQGNLK
ncbi:hypothetical protein [Flavobacterium sp. 245]|uniref:hypothetical protein n=1 Tax=Flavobacterium sp. 245 TaxID=2512115 RepID=UPI001061DD08|nr:hypothetical protein [Flavobacterium sp. 245]TDO99190.1 hypothetical protein EV145_10797 [Flavobacterium sp. 245]